MKKLLIHLFAVLAVCASTPAVGMKRKNEFGDKKPHQKKNKIT